MSQKRDKKRTYVYILCLYISDLGKKYYCKEDEREYGNKCYTMFLQPSNFLNSICNYKMVELSMSMAQKLYKTRYNTKTTIGLLVNGLLTYILHNQSRNLNASITLIDMFFFCSALMIQVHSMGTEYFTENSRCSSEMFAVPTMKMMLFYRDQLCIFWRL